jgi:hypothetical protein
LRKTIRRLLCGCVLSLPLAAQESPTSAAAIQRLLDRLASDETRIKEDEARIHDLELKLSLLATVAPPIPATTAAVPPPVPVATAAATPPPEPVAEPHGHEMRMGPGGPVLNIRGFTDLNLGFGQARQSADLSAGNTR